MRTFELEQTCECCPEQYWVKTGTETIGYIRLRFGHLTCEYLPQGKLTDSDIMVYEYTFNDRVDDEYKGCFDTEDERKYHLSKCKDTLIKEYQKQKQIAKKRQLNY